MEEYKTEYRDLLSKYFAGETSEEEIDILKTWLTADPENRRIFDQENELWQALCIRTKLEYYNSDTAWQELAASLKILNTGSGSVKIMRRVNYHLLIAAASVAILLITGAFALWIKEKNISGKMASVTSSVVTSEGEKASIFLPDSTRIVLNSGSSLSYEGSYNIRDRAVKFSGEAYFDVITNPDRPFIVDLGKIRIFASGTKFNILSFGNEDRIETTLEQGSIGIALQGRESVNINPGQQVVYFKKTGKYIVRNVVTETFTSWKDNKLRFIDTPLEEVLRKIGRKYNVRFEITSSDLLDLEYTGTFIDESIDDVMQMLKTVSPITYKIYYRTTATDIKYLKPRIVVGKRKIK